MFLNLVDISLERLRRVRSLRETRIPDVFEHRLSDLEEAFGRLQALEQFFEVAFDLIALDRLPITFAALGLTKIVGVLLTRLAG
ncbi:hypothetical protein [Ruegeria sp. HKCCA0370]|uniref:hypothetical protein n=1 Tax=Ruegeria sp. HKCCA0370 TaxID=2682995 RepID=UPI001C2C566B|nr:hypothetical protein [Ruegeria sp. HKCCA0370]